VHLRKRLELVVVAAGAAKRNSEKGRGRCAEYIVELIVAVHRELGGLVIPGAQPKKRRGDLCFCIRASDFVAGNLFGQEAVEWLVIVKGVDDVIAVAPGMRLRVV